MAYRVIEVVRDFLRGDLKVASKETIAERRAICVPCEARMMDVCTACGCAISLKTRLAKSSCPMELWQSVQR